MPGSPSDTTRPQPAESARQQTLSALFARIWRGVAAHRFLFVAVIVTAAFEAFFSKAPFLLIAPLFQAVQDADPLWVTPNDSYKSWLLQAFANYAQWLGDLFGVQFEGDDQNRRLVIFACVMTAALAGVFGGFAIYFATLTSRLFATRIVVDLRNEIADHLLRLPMRFYGRRRMGELISNMTNDTAVLSRSFTLAADHAAADPLQILVAAGILAAYEPRALIVLAILIPFMGLSIIRLGRKVHRRSRGSLEAMGETTESMNQMLTGIRTVKAYQLEDLRLQEFRHGNDTYLRRVWRMLQAKGRSQGMTFAGYQVAFAGLVGLFGWALLTGELEIEDVGVIGAPLATTYTHVKRLARTYNNLMESLGALDRVESLLGEQLDPGVRLGRTLNDVSGRVAMERVTFAYDEDRVLQDITFAVEPGTTVALVGPSGAGKSTSIDLLARFHDPSAGRVLIDGEDLRELDLASYRRRVAVVDQHPFLFNTTVYENIACGLPGASRQAVEDAARAAQAHDFIAALPNGYETIVGERGNSLSGGQQQRITIARAILRDPAILFLDEATSALDSESEGAVQMALSNLMRNRTSFVIAHRLSTIRDADLILVMEEGRIVQRGTHAELSGIEGGLYRRLLDRQQLD